MTCSNTDGGNIAASGACGTNGPPIPSCVDATPVTAEPELLDDFEDCNTCLRLTGGRRGFWFRFDGSGWQVPEIRPDTERASLVLRALGAMSATNTHWGLAVWPNATTYCNETPVNLSQYSGIAFWAKSVTGAALKLTVRDGATTVNTDTEGATSPSVPLSLTTSWAYYKVHWSEIKRPSDQTLADPQTITIIKWEGADAEAIYELLLDDVSFFND